MKNINVLIIAIFLVAITLGCGSSPAQQETHGPMNVPAWINELPPQDVFWGIGTAQLQNQTLAWQAATSRARRDIAEQISVQVQGMLTDYARESGLADSSRSIQSIENIGRDLVNLTISGATPVIREQTSDGTWWIRVEVSKTDTKNDINHIVNHEMADFAEFQAERALQMLDSQLDRLQSRPTPRSTD